MSLKTKAIGAAKRLKHKYDAQLKARTPVYLSPVRRIERVATHDRVVAMTFDDGPRRLPPVPWDDDTPLTTVLAETLEKYGARGTFDIVGDTSKNYPDTQGKDGSPLCGGIMYDHYPLFGQDSEAGALNCPELVKHILDGGHEITNHTYSHILFGPKPLIYGKRHPHKNLDAALDDVKMLHNLMKDSYGYEMKLSRPPHYVDKTKDGFSSYDLYALMGYQYMAASFDGAGWLPLSTYDAEVDATWKPIESKLLENPDYFCGQIIFEKDGSNMLYRTPVAHGLDKQLELLTSNGYRVVTVSELMEISPFADLYPEDSLFPSAKALLEKGFCICYRDNTIRKDTPLTRGELAMMRYGTTTAKERLETVKSKKSPSSDVKYSHPYAAAINNALKNGSIKKDGRKIRPDDHITKEEFSLFCTAEFGKVPSGIPEHITHESAIRLLAEII